MYFGPLVTLLPFCFCIVDQSYQFIYPTFLLPSETDAALSTDAAVPPSPPPDAAEEAATGRGPAARAGAARQVRRVLDVSGELAQRRVAPRDAALLQAAEQSSYLTGLLGKS